MIAVIFITFTKKLLGNKTESQMLWWQYLHLLSETMQTAQNNKLSVAFIYKRIIFILSNTCRGLIQFKKKGLVAERNKRCSNWILKKIVKFMICERHTFLKHQNFLSLIWIQNKVITNICICRLNIRISYLIDKNSDPGYHCILWY